MSIPHPGSRFGHAGRDAAYPSPRPGRLTLPSTLTASRLKITTMLNAAELLAIKPPHDQQRVTLRVQLPDRTITAEAAAKSLRKAQTAIREAGADNIALVLQGHLVAGDRVAEAGLSAQPRSPKAP